MEFTDVLLHLFNVSISASLLALAIALFRLIFKGVPKWLTVALWALVAIRLICPFSVESALSLIPSKEIIPSEIMSVDPTKTPNTAFGLIQNPTYSGFINSTVTVDRVNSFQLDVIFASYIWLAGVLLLLMYALVSWLRLRHTVRVSMPYKDNVFLCDRVKSPFILGVFRPKIYLPSDMDERTAELVLRHERAHLKRKDHLWKPLGFVLLSVYWFNPVLWLSYVLLCRDIELACDEKVIRDMENADKKAYSSALLSCSAPQKLISACPVAFGEVGVKKRIKSVLNYKKPAFWVILIAVVVSIVLAVCFMTDPKKTQGEHINGVDEISELHFPMRDIVFVAHTYTVYHGIGTADDYFKAKIEDAFSHTEVSSFLDHIVLDELPDGTVNPMHEPQTDFVIEVNVNDHAPTRLIFHDNFSKMYMVKFTDFYSVRSKDYAVVGEQAREFFETKPYMNHSLVWEFNPASSALGHGEINVFVGEKYEISGEVTGTGKITRISDEEKGEGITWSPEILERPEEYKVNIPVIRNGEEATISFTIAEVGKRGLSTYYTLRADDLVIASYPDGYSFELSEAQTKEPDDASEGFYDLELQVFEQNEFVNLIMTSPAFVSTEEKEAVVYNGVRILWALDEWKFEKGFYAHPSKEDLENMKKYSIEVDGDGGKTYGISFNKNCSQMWFSEKGDSYSSTFKVKNSKAVKDFFEEEKFFEPDFVWEYNPSASTYGYITLQLIVEGEYESYTAECSEGTLMTAAVSSDRTGGIVHSEPLKKITCTKEDNLVWRPADNGIRSTETIYVEQKLANGDTKDFYVYLSDVGVNYSGHTLYEVRAESANLMMKKSGSNVSCYFDQTYDVNWLYNPMASATWYYITTYFLPDGYEIKSAVATSGEASVKELYYSDSEKCVQWTPDEYVKEDAVLTVFAVKDGKEIHFTVDIELLDANPETSGRRTYRISPEGCKLREQGTATFLLEEK